MKRSVFLITMLFPLFLNGQYISDVLDYLPAPGQYINSYPIGVPSSAQSIVGTTSGMVNLGFFGGYLVFKFENPVENHPDNPFGVDFTLFGNPLPHWSEPAVVWVMRDDNANGEADDTWYELAGSDYFFSSSLRNLSVRYENPGKEDAGIKWTDDAGNTGLIPYNSYHQHSYYPDPDSFSGVSADYYSLSGSLIQASIDLNSPTGLKSFKKAFGYADNQPIKDKSSGLPDNPYTPEAENSGGDAFDINWAIDQNGEYVDLDRVHFIKVVNGVRQLAGWLGELSSEICGAVDVSPAPGVSGNTDLIVIKEIPDTLTNFPHPLEAFWFKKGRNQKDAQFVWTTSSTELHVDDENSLHVSAEGNFSLNARIPGTDIVSADIEFFASPVSTTILTRAPDSGLEIYPNPVSDVIKIRAEEHGIIRIVNAFGRIVQIEKLSSGQKKLNITDLPPGMYFIELHSSKTLRTSNFIKK